LTAKLIYSFLFTLLLHSAVSKASALTDTIYKKKPKVENEKKLKDRIFVPPLVLKTSPTAVLWGGVFPYTAEYRLMAEITGGRRQSQQFAVSYLGKSIYLDAALKAAGATEFYKVAGWRVQYALKFFWIGRRHYAPYGFYFGPLVSYANARVSTSLKGYYSHSYFDFRHYSFNGIIGVQAGKINRMTVDIYAGLGYKNNKVFYHTSTFKTGPYDTKDFGELYNSHLNGVFGVNLGYSF